MKTTFAISAFIRPAIVAHYGDERAAQIERNCNGELNNKEVVKATAGKTRWNGQLNGGNAYSVKGSFKSSEVAWKETEETKYTVKNTTAPLEFVKFNGALEALYRKTGDNPSGVLPLAVIPKLCIAWFDEMHSKATGKANLKTGKVTVNKPNRDNKPKTGKPVETPKSTETNGQPETAAVS